MGGREKGLGDKVTGRLGEKTIMTPEEINKTIAEACGWTYITSLGSGRKPDHGSFRETDKIPNYYGDLNACHEMEKGLKNWQQWDCYIENLIKSVEDYLVHATAPQRCEAFLKTIGKWKE